jgi:hypothetical protein
MAAKVLDYYPYDVSHAAAIVVAVLYTMVAAVTVFQYFYYRSWVWLVMVIASLMESGGYISRSISTWQVSNRSLYIVQFALVILAPVLMAAGFYVVFGRIVFLVMPPEARRARTLWVPPRFCTPIFVTCDIIAFFIQAVGAITVAGTKPTDPDRVSKLDKGKKIVLIGLGVQMACFGLFSVIAIRFHFVSRRFTKSSIDQMGVEPGTKYWHPEGSSRKLKTNWGSLLWVVNLACILVLVRSIYRIVEFAMGPTGYPNTHEWTFYIFDTLPIFPCVAMFNWWHPSKYLLNMGFRQSGPVVARQREFEGPVMESTA